MRTANIYVTLNIYTILVLLIVLVVCIIQRKQSQLINRYLIGWIFAHIMMLCCDSIRWCLRGKMDTLGIFVLMYILEYIFGHVCLVLFHYYLCNHLEQFADAERRIRLIAWPVLLGMSALWILSYGNHMFYTITYNAVNIPEAGYYFSQLPAILLLLFDMILVFLHRKMFGWRVVLNLWIPMIFPIIAFPLQVSWNVHILFIGMALALLCQYVTISSEQNRLLAESRAHLAESRIAITMSQIRPHFLYNALGSISALCDIDPALARDATDHFAEYLRMNLETLERFAPIPFQTELKHIQTYIWLEKIRFGDKLEVTYEILAKDFQVPALSVQPLVENAVKHGLCRREDGGSIAIRTREESDAYVIQVCDNGVGFSLNEIGEESDRAVHIGVRNVQNRLDSMVGGTLAIESGIGEGTTATIRIPKRVQKSGTYVRKK